MIEIFHDTNAIEFSLLLRCVADQTIDFLRIADIVHELIWRAGIGALQPDGSQFEKALAERLLKTHVQNAVEPDIFSPFGQKP